MEKFVINIGRELGSGGRIIGKRLSELFDIEFYDKEFINIVSEESGLNKEFFEKPDEKRRFASIQNFFGLRASFVDTGISAAYNNYLCNDSIFKIQSDVIRKLASEHSAVFVGRCADYVLRDHPKMVSIFITAPMVERIQRTCEYMGLDPDNKKDRSKAEAEIRKTDRNRSRYYDYYSNKSWGAAQSYHFCIDSSKLGLEGTALFIKEFTERVLNI